MKIVVLLAVRLLAAGLVGVLAFVLLPNRLHTEMAALACGVVGGLFADLLINALGQTAE